jgi:hypothetical protein
MRGFQVVLSLILVLVVGKSVWAQPDTLWTCRIPFTASVDVYAATELADGGFAVTGTCNPQGNYDIFVARVTQNGNVVWARKIGSSGWNEQGWGIVETPTGGLVVAGGGSSGTLGDAVMLYGLSAQGDSLWQRIFPGSGLTRCHGASSLPDGNFALIGYKLGADGTHSDLWLLKCRPTGDTLWTRTLGGAGTDIGTRVAPCADGSLVLAGYSSSWGQGGYDFWLTLADSGGAEIRRGTAGTAQTERCWGSAAAEWGFFLSGYTTNGANNDGYLAKMDAQGNRVWSLPYRSDSTVVRYEEQLRGVAWEPDGGAFCVGWAGNDLASAHPWILVVSAEGAREVSRVDSSFTVGWLFGILTVNEGGKVAYGSVVEGGSRKGYLMRFPPPSGIRGIVTERTTGAHVAGVRVGTVGSARYSITNSQGHFALDLLAGHYDVTAWGPCVSRDTVIGIDVIPDSLTDVNLEVGLPDYEQPQTSINVVASNHVETRSEIWVANLGDGALEFRVKAEPLVPPTSWLRVDPDTGLIQPGDTTVIGIYVLADTTDDGVYDYFGYVTIHSNSCPDSVDHIPLLATILDADRPVPPVSMTFALHGAWPNPFNSTTILSYEIPRDGTVHLTVYDIAGRRVRELVGGFTAAGRHEVPFDASGLASGVYIARLESEARTATTKLLLLR